MSLILNSDNSFAFKQLEEACLWSDSDIPITFVIDTNAFSSDEVKAIKSAFNKWGNIEGSRLRFKFESYNGQELNPNPDKIIDPVHLITKAKVSEVPYFYKNNLENNAAYTYLACQNGRIINASIIVKDSLFELWRTFDSCSWRPKIYKDLESAMLHEIGHFIGLAHPHEPTGNAEKEQTIMGTIELCQFVRNLYPDDLNAARSLYPSDAVSNDEDGWAKTFGGNNADYLLSIYVTSDNGCVALGETYSFGKRKGDLLIIKLDSKGNIQWQKTYYEGKGDMRGTSIQQTSDNGYIVSALINVVGRREDAWILKLDSSGNIQWQKTYGGVYEDQIKHIQQTPDKGYIAVGDTYSFGAGNVDAWVLKLDSKGDIQWQKTYGSDSWDTAYSIQQTLDGGYVFSGQTHAFGSKWYDAFHMWVVKINSKGDIQWQKTYGSSWSHTTHWIGANIQQTYDNGFIVSGTKHAGMGAYDIVILKLNSNGTIKWQKAYGGIGNDERPYIQQTSDNGYILAGLSSSFSTNSRSSYWVSKLNASGDIQWEKIYKSPFVGIYDSTPFISTTHDGYILGGHTNKYGVGLEDLWLLKLNSVGYIGTSCDLIEISNAKVINTDIIPINSAAVINNSKATVAITTAVTQDSDATVTTQCLPQ